MFAENFLGRAMRRPITIKGDPAPHKGQVIDHRRVQKDEPHVRRVRRRGLPRPRFFLFIRGDNRDDVAGDKFQGLAGAKNVGVSGKP
jgi:hypothetical protein